MRAGKDSEEAWRLGAGADTAALQYEERAKVGNRQDPDCFWPMPCVRCHVDKEGLQVI